MASLTLTEVERLRKKYPDRVPLLLIKSPKTTIDIPKKKFLAPSSLTLSDFLCSIRKLYKVPPEKAIFFYVNNTLPNIGELISTIHQRHKDKDGTLHLTYSEENTFG
jgi:GABA(A) receptor-associated protein